MTKAAVTMLTKTLATEVGRHGIRVNAIAPGMILTNFSRHNFVDEKGDVIPEKLEQYHKNAGRCRRSVARESRRRRALRSSISSPTPPPSSPVRSNAQRRRVDALVGYQRTSATEARDRARSIGSGSSS
jgi:NAD(P)-dependent dehydrogenase (short-subunit alcohol dehydrogenase family)